MERGKGETRAAEAVVVAAVVVPAAVVVLDLTLTKRKGCKGKEERGGSCERVN